MSVRLRARLRQGEGEIPSDDVVHAPPEHEELAKEVCFYEQTRPSGEARMALVDLQGDYIVPDKYMLGSNMNHILPEYRNKRKQIKNQREVGYWQKKINEQLLLYNIQDDKYNIKLVRGLCQIVEKYVCYDSKLGETKKQIVMNCALRFFDNNSELLESVIENELDHIERSSMLMRMLAKIEIFFFAKP